MTTTTTARKPSTKEVLHYAKTQGLRKMPGTLNGSIYFRRKDGVLLTLGQLRDAMVGA